MFLVKFSCKFLHEFGESYQSYKDYYEHVKANSICCPQCGTHKILRKILSAKTRTVHKRDLPSVFSQLAIFNHAEQNIYMKGGALTFDEKRFLTKVQHALSFERFRMRGFVATKNYEDIEGTPFFKISPNDQN